MVVVGFCDEINKVDLSFSNTETQKGVTKNGAHFMKVPLRFKEKGSLVLFAMKCKTFGLREIRGKRGQFSIGFVLSDSERKCFEDLERRLQKKAKALFPDFCFEGFTRLHEGRVFCRVPFCPKRRTFFATFTDGKDGIISGIDLFCQCLVDFAMSVKRSLYHKRKGLP